jgi:hypothetical protein
MTELFVNPTEKRLDRRLHIFRLIENNHTKEFATFVKLAGFYFDVHMRDLRPEYSGWTLLHHAAACNNAKLVSFLLARGHAIDPIDSTVSMCTPLMTAVANNATDVMVVLIQQGANLEHQDCRGDNVLHYAARISALMAERVVEASALTRTQIQSVASTSNVKNKFPEDLACNEMAKTSLVSFRSQGYCYHGKSAQK